MSKRRYRRLSAEQWQSLIDEQQRSGLSQRAFCEAHGLAIATFKNWKRRLGVTALDSPGGFERLFAPLHGVALSHEAEEEAGCGWDIELDLGAGVCLRLHRR